MILKVKKLKDNARIPAIATAGSAGMDLCACTESDITLEAGGSAVIPTGIAIEMSEAGYAAFIYGRSGLGIKHGIAPGNCVGVIDSDYRGEICVGLANHGREPYTIKAGERIAQMVIAPVVTPQIVETDELSDTARGAGGFGSTGKYSL